MRVVKGKGAGIDKGVGEVANLNTMEVMMNLKTIRMMKRPPQGSNNSTWNGLSK